MAWQVADEQQEEAFKCPDCERAVRPTVSGAGNVLRASLYDHHQPIGAAAFSADSRLFAASGGVPTKHCPGSTVLWDTTACVPVATLQWHREAVSAVAFSPSRPLAATGSRDGSIALWDVGRGLYDAVIGFRERSLSANAGGVESLSFSASGDWLASTGVDQSIMIWNTASWRQETSIIANRDGCCHAAFSPCGRYLAGVWRSRGAAIFWDVGTWREYLQFKLPTEEDGASHALAFSPDGNRLAVLGDNEIRIWDISTCQVITSIRIFRCQALAWSPLGKLIATGGSMVGGRAPLRLWDADTGVEVDQLAGQLSPMSAVAFSPDGKLLGSGSPDSTASLWTLAAEHASAR